MLVDDFVINTEVTVGFFIFMVLQITEITLHSEEEKNKKGKKT